MRKHMIKITAWLCLPMCLLLPIAGFADLVICYGSDGHVAIESAQKGSCCTESSDTSTRILSKSVDKHILYSTGDPCGPCVDFPLLVGRPETQFISTKNTSFQKQSLVFDDFNYVISNDGNIVDQHLFPEQPLAIRSALISLRTTILLI